MKFRPSLIPVKYFEKLRHFTIIPFLIFSVLAGIFLPRLQLDPTIHIETPEGHGWFERMGSLEEEFLSGTTLIVSIEAADDLYSVESFERIQKVTAVMEQVEGIQSVFSIINLKDIDPDASDLEFVPLLEGEITADKLSRLERQLEDNPFFREMLISTDRSAWTVYGIPDLEADSLVLASNLIEATEGFGYVHLFGLPVVEHYMAQAIQHDLTLLLLISCIFILVIQVILSRDFITGLILWFSSLLPALWVMGLFPIFGIPMRMETIIVPVQVLALSTSYGIHIVRYYKFHVERGIGYALEHTTIIISMAGLTTLMGFSSLLISKLPNIRITGAFLMAGIVFSIIGALFMLPGLLRMIRAKKLHTQELKGSRFYFARYTIPVIIVAAIIAFCAGGIFRVQSDYRMNTDFKKNHEIPQILNYFGEHYGGMEEMVIYVSTEEEYGLVDVPLFVTMKDILESMKEEGLISSVVSFIDPVEWVNGRLSGESVPVTPEIEEHLGETLELLITNESGLSLGAYINTDWSRARITLRYGNVDSSVQEANIEQESLVRFIERKFAERLPEVNIDIGGNSLGKRNIIDAVVNSQIRSIFYFFPILLILLLLIFRSFKWAVFTLIPPFCAVIFFFGFMGWTGISLVSYQSLAIAVILGVSVDDVIYFMIFFRQQLMQGQSNTEALKGTIHKAGVPIIQTTVVLAIGFSVMLFSVYTAVSDTGLLTIFTLFFATLVTLTVIPTLLKNYISKKDAEKVQAKFKI